MHTCTPTLIITTTTMERVPVFIYDRVNAAHDLLFIDRNTLCKSTLNLDDNNTGSSRVCVTIPPVSDDRPHRMIIHEDGDNMIMLAVHDAMIQAVKAHMFTKELIRKHMDKTYKSKRRGVQKRKSRFA